MCLYCTPSALSKPRQEAHLPSEQEMSNARITGDKQHPHHRSGLFPGQRHQFALGMMPAGGRGKGDGACCQAEPPLECSLRDPGPRIVMDHPFFFSLGICFERVLKLDSWREGSIETDSYWLAPPGKKALRTKKSISASAYLCIYSPLRSRGTGRELIKDAAYCLCPVTLATQSGLSQHAWDLFAKQLKSLLLLDSGVPSFCPPLLAPRPSPSTDSFCHPSKSLQDAEQQGESWEQSSLGRRV